MVIDLNGSLLDGIREIGNYRTQLAIGLPLLGGAMVVASSVLMPRGMAKGLLTGAYLLLASLGAACLLIAAIKEYQQFEFRKLAAEIFRRS